MNKIALALIIIMYVSVQSGALSAPEEIDRAIGLAYNFEFERAEELLENFRKENPADIRGDMGRVVIDFLLVKQYPEKENFDRIHRHIREAEVKLKESYGVASSHEENFQRSFFQYYAMKSYALQEKWINTLTHGLEARKLALALEEEGRNIPDLYFILGEIDYTVSLAPDQLAAFLSRLDFTPDRQRGLAYIHNASLRGELTRREAAIMYISSSLYIEKDYVSAMSANEDFLREYPGNVSARFFQLELLFRLNRIEEAAGELAKLESDISRGILGGKWVARFYQMQGNLYSAKGDYPGALDLYRKALDQESISEYTAAETALEAGKLLDILGRRREALEAYRICYRGKGLPQFKDEARRLSKDPYTGIRGTY